MKPTDISAPDYFHKVVDCQWACPAHTPVPEYIRLIAEGRYSDAYMINWRSNVFPGILGRTCDRPCEPACRRGRVEETPVAICRLKRVAADFKDDVKHRMPRPSAKNGRRIAIVGGGPASLTVARDLAPLGYHCTLFDSDPKAGGMMRTQIPKFRLPDSVIDEETDYILDLGIEFRGGQRIDSLKKLLGENYDAIFVGSGAPRGRELDIPGRKEAANNIHIGIDWLSSVSFGHTDKIGKRVIVLGGGNTAMDCCRTARRRAGRGRPGERVSLDRARLRGRIRPAEHAQGRCQDHGVDPSQSVLRRRRRLRPQKHHLGGGARPRRRAFDPQASLRRRHYRASAARGADLVAEDGYPRMELRQRYLQRQALQGAASRQGRRAEGYSRRSRARLRRQARAR